MAHTLQGIVTSDKRDKTITVSITSRETHPLYRKQYTKTRKYTAHDEKNEARTGDRVEIIACRPLSKTKAYRLVKVLERSHGSVELKDEVLGVVPEVEGAKTEPSETLSRNPHEDFEVSEPRNDGSERAGSKKAQSSTTKKEKAAWSSKNLASKSLTTAAPKNSVSSAY